MVQQIMYPAQPDSPDFELAADITTMGQTDIIFVSLVGLLTAPNTLTIRQGDSDTTPETVYYATDPVGTTLTVTRGQGGTVAKTFTAGAKACRAHTALDHNTIRSNILDIVSTIAGLAVDTDVFHKATAGEINALVLKVTPDTTDVLMIEDSTGSLFGKKKIAISTLPFQTVLTNPVSGPGSGATVGHLAIMNNTAGTLIADGGAIPVVPAFETSATNIKMNGTQALGSSGNVPDAAHVHPTDTSRQATLTNPVIGLTASFVSGDVITGTGTGDQVQDSGVLLTNLVLTNDTRLSVATASTIGLCPILENTGLKYLRDDGTWVTPSSSTGTVTSVASGNGMNFTTITGIGTVTMGTPGSITSTSTNAVTTTSHTHAIDNTIFTASNGKSVTPPVIDGTATIGATNTWADGGHIHPTDTSRAATNQALDTFGAATNNTTLDATTTAHGLLLTAVAPATGFMRFVGLTYGETSYALKELFAVTTPSMDGSASAGTALTAARIDHVHPSDTSRAAATSLGAWAAFPPSPTWGTADPTITTTVARYARTGNIVTFNVSFVISNGNDSSSLTMALPVTAPQIANCQLPLIAFKKITFGGNSIMSDPFAYIDYTLATPVIKFNQFGTLPSGYTAVLNISGSYEVE
jgi:hypothetical protein